MHLLLLEIMKTFLILFVLVPALCLSQERPMFSSVRLKPLKEKYNVDSITIIYPIIKLHNKLAYEKINKIIRETLLPEYNDEDSSIAIDSLVKLSAADGLTSMSYKSSFNKNGILSLQIFIDAVAAYPTSWQEELNFDINTGDLITMKNIIKPEKYKLFRQLVYQDKINAIKKYQIELKNYFSKKEFDKETYEWASEEVKHCMDSVSFEKFILTGSALQIFDGCDFPHMIQAIGPAYDLRYKLSSIRSYVRDEIFRKLTH